MIISYHRRFVFVHIHKCAGTSIETALARHVHEEDLVIGSVALGGRDQDHYKRTIGLDKHSTALQARGFLGAESWPSFHSFATVRHPIDRLRSLYGFSRKVIENHPMTEDERARFALDGAPPKRRPFRWKAVRAALAVRSFEEFALHPLTMEDKGAMPQWRSVCDDEGRLLVQDIGRVEDLEADWGRICGRLGIDAPLGLKNTSGARGGREELAAEVRSRLVEHYRRDFEMFGYDTR